MSERRAVVLVPNAFAPYSRALRVGRALMREGYTVEVAAVADGDHPAREEQDGLQVRRYAATTGEPTAAGDGQPRARRVRAGTLGGEVERWREALAWPPERMRAWWATLEADLEPADLYHCCSVFGLPPALRVRDREGRGQVVYDVVDDWFRSEWAARMPGPVRAARMIAEARRVRRADGVVTVNSVLARQLQRRWHPARPVVSVPNYPQIPPPEALRQDLIRRELGIDASTPIVLFQGMLNSRPSVTFAERAALGVPGAVFVVMGFGTQYEAIRRRDDDPAVKGRHFTLPAKHPDELIAWSASADVMLTRMRTRSVNDRLSTPNKLWEALAGGTPMVVTRDHVVMARLIERLDLGAVATALTPAAVSEAIASVLRRPPDERAEMRRRIAAHAREHWDWSVAEAAYRQLIGELSSPGSSGSAGSAAPSRKPPSA